MEYRRMGTNGPQVSALSIGAMRLPRDHDEAVGLLRKAIDSGCTYIDTSRGYGESELKLAKALKDGYREKVVLSTKCSPWIFKEEGYEATADHARRKIDDSMASGTSTAPRLTSNPSLRVASSRVSTRPWTTGS